MTNPLAQKVVREARTRRATVATAESCTGGLVAAAITDVAGASAVLRQGVVTYANEAKTDLLGVPDALIAQHGAVSAEVAEAMVAGLCARTPPLPRSAVTVGVSVTGIAGPGGGSPGKPVGLVWFGMSGPQGIRLERRVFAGGDRRFVRQRSVETALRFLLQTIRTV